MTKSDREIMEILEAYDLTRCACGRRGSWPGVTRRRLPGMWRCGMPVAIRSLRAPRPKLIDGFLPKVEELVEASKGKIRADEVHRAACW